MSKIVLVIVAHSDDETIAMAGTIKKHVRNGDRVNVISMTNGVSARQNGSKSDIAIRKKASINASKILGFEWGPCYDFNDNAMDQHSVLEVTRAIERVKEIYKPSIVYTHSGADLNIDHRVVANAVLTAFRPQPMENCKEIRLFEVASATDFGSQSLMRQFSPNLYVDITEDWDKKVDALNAYSLEMREYPHSRSVQGIENLARVRGNQVGVELAESFEIIRRLE